MRQSLVNIKHYGEWLALRAAMWYVGTGDSALAFARVQRLAKIARHVLRNDWAWALKNLHLVFGPALNEQDRTLLAKIALEQHLLSYVEGLRGDNIPVQVVNGENAIEAYERGRGVLVCGVHLGSWESGVKWSAGTGYPIVCVYRRAYNPLSDQEFRKVRTSYGVEWVCSDDLGGIVSALRDRKIVLMMMDLNTPTGGIAADFMGIPAMCPVGPAMLALEMRCPIIPCVSIREGLERIQLHIEPQIQFSATGSANDLTRLTRQINRTFEPWILQYAEQYNWFHPRWRARPDGTTWKLSDPVESFWRERTASFPVLLERVRTILQAR